MSPSNSPHIAIIAGNGEFPFLVLRAAREQDIDPLVVAIKEETSPGIEQEASRVHWLSLGEAFKLFELLRTEEINQVMLAGQVKHHQIYSSIPPDPLMSQALGQMPRRNTDTLIGTFVKMIENMGIQVVDSTLFLKHLLAGSGTLTRRGPDESEQADIRYGCEIAKKIAELDVGQTVVVADRACVAVEAMEGTDAAIERAAMLSNGKRLVVVKVSKPSQDMRFDVPVVGVKTIQVMARSNARALAVDAGKTLLFERPHLLEEADTAGIAVVGISDLQ